MAGRTARNSRPLEVLGMPLRVQTARLRIRDSNCPGTYDPIPKKPEFGEGRPFKDIRLDSLRAKYWLGVGAQPSDPAWRLLSMVRNRINTGKRKGLQMLT